MIKSSTAVLLLLLATASCLHAERFHFIANDEVLATIEFSQIPATIDDFVSLTFTPAGDELFGFGPTYTGDFDIMSSLGVASRPRFVISELDGGLSGIDNDGVEWASMRDSDPPSSTTLPGASVTGGPSFFVTAGNGVPLDTLGLGLDFIQDGQFLPVPEPSFPPTLFVVAIVIWSQRRRRTANI